MKLRQKLAAVLAATMIVSAVPVVTMAASDNKVTNGVVVGTKDSKLTDKGLTQNIIITPKDSTTGSGMFFINLTNAEWTTSAGIVTTGAGTQISNVVANGKELAISFTSVANLGAITIDLGSVKLTGGDASYSIDGNGTVISNQGAVVFATTSDAKANVTVGDAVSAYTERITVANITVEEAIKGSLEDKEIKFTLDSGDYKIVSGLVTPQKGFSAANVTSSTGVVVTTDDEVATFKFTTSPSGLQAPGRLVFSLVVEAKTKTPATGDLKVKVSGDKINEATVKVATIKEYGSTLTMKDSKPVDVTAGKKVATTFSIKEDVDKTLIDGRKVEVTLDKGYLSNIKNATIGQLSIGSIKLNDGSDLKSSIGLDVVKNSDGYVTGFSFTMPTLAANKLDELKFTDVDVYMPVNVTGDVTLKATGRALDKDLTVVAAKVVAPVTVVAEPVTLKVGLKDQVGGKVTITETDKAKLKQGEYVEIELDSSTNTKIGSAGTLTVVSGDIKIEDFKTSGSTIVFKVKRASTVASTIEIKDMKFTPDRTVPQGNYDAKVTGLAVAPECTIEKVNVPNFMIIGTPNTEDLATNGLKKVVASFVIDSNKYTVNGVTKEMDATAFVDGGRTMVPLRFAANALGVEDTDIYYADNTASIVAGGKTYSVKLGSKTAYVNGVPAQSMLVAPVMKNDRIYVPISEIGKLLGVESSWDAATQTATFTNK